jgi:HD domain
VVLRCPANFRLERHGATRHPSSRRSPLRSPQIHTAGEPENNSEDIGAPPDLTFARRLPVTRDAIAYAQELHAGQQREADATDFLIHPIEASALLKRSHCPDHVVAAAVLHDVLEDTAAERTDIERRFGPEVSALVAVMTDDPAIADEEARKDDVRERVRRAGGDALVVYVADKICKTRELRMLIATGAPRRTTDAKLARYRKSLDMLEEELPDSQLVEILRFELETLEAFPPGAD